MPVIPLMGVCAKCVSFQISNDNIVTDVQFVGGCPGNGAAVCKLVEGMTADAVVAKLSGITCGTKPTSCPDQLARAVKRELSKRKSQ